jgi:uncharacterized FlaG/YvyC family protein
LKANNIKKVHQAEKKHESKSHDDNTKSEKKPSHEKSKSDKIAEDQYDRAIKEINKAINKIEITAI